MLPVKGFFVVMAILVFGYFAGSEGRKLIAPQDPKAEVAIPKPDPIRRVRVVPAAPSVLVSNDTIDTLLQLPVDQLYHRLALWLLDAPAHEIEELWKRYSKRADCSDDLDELILIGWAGIDPESAIATVTAVEYDKGPWRAWACHEPERALDSALSRFRKMEDQTSLIQVLRGIGEFHPKWLRENFDDLPEQWMGDEALAGYLRRTDTENPRESIRFLQEKKAKIPVKTLLALGLQDPVAAHSLAMEIPPESRPSDFTDRLARGNPAAVEILLARTTAPRERMQLRLKQFESRAKSDPLAVEEMIRELPSSWLKDGGLAILANHYLDDDPAKAVELTAEILLQANYEEEQSSRIYLGRGGLDPKKLAPSPAKSLVNRLVQEAPAELMAAIEPEDGFPTSAYRDVVETWADHDAVGFAEWARDVEQPFTYVVAAGEVTSRLLADKQYPEAMEWAESIPAATGKPSYHLGDVYGSWLREDPDAAKSWRAGARLSEAQKRSLRRFKE